MTVAVAPPRPVTDEERRIAQDLLSRARAAMRAVESYDQPAVDRLCRAVAWAGGNETTATRLAKMSVEESGMGSPEPRRRAKVLGILRDALRQKSIGVIEAVVKTDSPLIGRTAGRLQMRDRLGINLIAVSRAGSNWKWSSSRAPCEAFRRARLPARPPAPH